MKNVWLELKQKLFVQNIETENVEQNLQLAAAGLMIEMCESDFSTSPEELEAVRHALLETFNLNSADIDLLVEQAHTTHHELVSTHHQIATINQLCSPEEKLQLVEQLWRVAFADGRLDKYEEHYLRKLCDLIYVPHRKFLQAKHKVEAGLSQT